MAIKKIKSMKYWGLKCPTCGKVHTIKQTDKYKKICVYCGNDFSRNFEYNLAKANLEAETPF